MEERFYADSYGGTYSVTREDLQHILSLKTEIEIDAVICGCTVEDIEKWLKWSGEEASHLQCFAKTRKGERCKNLWYGSFDYQMDIGLYLNHVQKYGYEPSGYCKKHSK